MSRNLYIYIYIYIAKVGWAPSPLERGPSGDICIFRVTFTHNFFFYHHSFVHNRNQSHQRLNLRIETPNQARLIFYFFFLWVSWDTFSALMLWWHTWWKVTPMLPEQSKVERCVVQTVLNCLLRVFWVKPIQCVTDFLFKLVGHTEVLDSVDQSKQLVWLCDVL